ncbi:replicative DNA helicase [Clostridium paraputrificum]|jgi:replicative DNA helicase|uniref:replicative DNA helicase n=1 Tax=Clostridium paraputrificum TaxID=29363 RepID=UPI000DD0D28A|nr:replicative DNA helicase [Clostridium paraputrificum]MDB2105443.1 replicative DNA helicase [Clostridium paraputrificum]MDB2112497.1 replicative DNA helicase [Clostridium paraputrificum]DAU88757.1 MAG TPA: DnaB-like replicative helicase [Caudoviricetes sp.]
MNDTRQLPHSIEAEQAALGCIINYKSQLALAEDVLKDDDFYWDKHKRIFSTIKALSRKDMNIDLITLLNELKVSDSIDKCGGVSYITELATNTVFSSNVESYVKIIKDKSDRRNLIRAGRELISKSYEESEVESIISTVEDKIYKVINSKESEDILDMGQSVEKVLTRIENNYCNGGKILGNTTGFKEIDNTISGLQKGDFIIVAARPSMGKTAFALNIGQHASKGASVGIFSLEMTTEQLMERLISSRSLVEFGKIKTGKLDEAEFRKITDAANVLAKRKIFIDDKSTNLSDIKAKCRNLKIKEGLDVVIIDYLQLIEISDKTNSREQEIAKISRELKKLAKKLEITIVALSQLSRAPEQRTDHKPILSDLRESGSIEQDADVIFMLYRDEYYNKESEEKNIAEVIINKNRNGETKTIKLGWIGQYQRFATLDRENC